MAREILIKIDGDPSGLGRALGKADGDTARFAAEAKGHFGGLLSSVGAVGAAIAGLGAVSFAGGQLLSAISGASDLAETTSKVGVLFGENAQEIEAFAATASKAFGQSKQEAMDAAATFATFGRAAGLSGKELVSFSTDMTALASDMASFSNSSTEESIEAIGAALRGEAEPIRRFGVLLDDAVLREEALRLGLVKTTKEALTPQQKVLAAQAAIMRQTTAAQGDFARTSGGLANQQRILKAEFANVKAEIGQGLLPVALSLVSFANEKLLPALADVAPKVAAFAEAGSSAVRLFAQAWSDGVGDVRASGWLGVIQEIGGKLGFVFFQVQTAVGDAAEFLQRWWPAAVAEIETMKPALELVGAAAVGLLSTFKLFSTVKVGAQAVASFAAALGPWGIAAAAAAGAFLALYRIFPGFKAFVDGMIVKAKAFAAELVATFEADGLGAAVRLLGDRIWQGIKAGFDFVRDNAPGWWAAFTDWLVGTALPWLDEMTLKLARQIGEWIVAGAVYLKDNLPGWLAALVDWMTGSVLPWLGDQAAELASLIADWVVAGAKKLRENLPGWVEDFTAWMIGTALPTLVKFGVEAAIKLAVWVKDAADKLVENLPKWTAAFWLWVITDGIPSLARAGKDLAEGLGKAMLASLDFAWDIGVAIVKGIVRGLKDMGGFLADEAKKLVSNAVPGPIKDVLGISSPSKVGIEIGSFFTEGLAIGLLQNASTLTRGSELLATSAMVEPVRAARPVARTPPETEWRQAGPQTIVIQLDGRELARALVPHQRSVIRAAG